MVNFIQTRLTLTCKRQDKVKLLFNLTPGLFLNQVWVLRLDSWRGKLIAHWLLIILWQSLWCSGLFCSLKSCNALVQSGFLNKVPIFSTALDMWAALILTLDVVSSVWLSHSLQMVWHRFYIYPAHISTPALFQHICVCLVMYTIFRRFLFLLWSWDWWAGKQCYQYLMLFLEHYLSFKQH